MVALVILWGIAVGLALCLGGASDLRRYWTSVVNPDVEDGPPSGRRLRWEGPATDRIVTYGGSVPPAPPLGVPHLRLPEAPHRFVRWPAGHPLDARKQQVQTRGPRSERDRRKHLRRPPRLHRHR